MVELTLCIHDVLIVLCLVFFLQKLCVPLALVYYYQDD